MKTYAPKSLRGEDLRQIIADMGATPAQVAKFLEVTERSVWRWMADGSAPRAVLYCLWYESGPGREAAMNDAGALLNLTRSDVKIKAAALAVGEKQLAKLLAIADTGAANDPLMLGPVVLPTQQRINALMGLAGGVVGAGGAFVQAGQIGPNCGV